MLHDTDALSRIFRTVARHTNIDARVFQNCRGDIVFPARVVDGICAGIALRHIGTNGTGEPHGTKRTRKEDDEELMKAEKLEAVVKRQLFQYKQISDDVAFDISQLPRDLILHLLSQLDYSALLKFNASSKMAHSLVEKSGALYNFSNTRYIIGQLTKACISEDRELLRRGMQACSYYMPALFMLFTGALMDLTAWVQGRGAHSFTGMEKSPVRMIVSWITQMTTFRTEARAEYRTFSFLAGYEGRKYDRIYNLSKIALKNANIYAASSSEYNDDWFLHSTTLPAVEEWEALVIRTHAAHALQWLYGDPGVHIGEVIGLDPDTSFLATCAFNAKFGYSKFSRYGDVTFVSQPYLPATAGVALRIMARCSSPAVTCGAYFGKYEILPVSNEVGEVRSIRQVGPVALSYMALFCAPSAIELAAKAGCLSQLAQQVLAVAWRNPIWELAFINFYKNQPTDKYLRDLEMSGYFDIDDKIRNFIERVRREWTPGEHEDEIEEAPGGSPTAVAHARAMLANSSSLRLFGFTDKALAHALFAPQTVHELLFPDVMRNPRYTILYNAMSDKFKRLVMQSPFAEYILTDTSDAHLANHLPALNEVETIRTAFWIGATNGANYWMPETLFRELPTLVQKASVLVNYLVGYLVDQFQTIIPNNEATWPLALRGVQEYFTRIEASRAEWSLLLHRTIVAFDFVARSIPYADSLMSLSDGFAGPEFTIYMLQLGLDSYYYIVRVRFGVHPDEVRRFDYVLLQRGLTDVSKGDASVFFRQSVPVLTTSVSSAAAAAAAATPVLGSTSSLSVAP